MNRKALALVALVCLVAASVSAEFTVTNEGTWPSSWPSELEPLRSRSRTLHGGMRDLLVYYEIPFAERDEFEAAWPHLLKVRSEGTPLVLLASPDRMDAGVRIRCPSGRQTTNQAELRQNVIFLVVDGRVVDLNRIRIPPDTVIDDRRFDERKDHRW